MHKDIVLVLWAQERIYFILIHIIIINDVFTDYWHAALLLSAHMPSTIYNVFGFILFCLESEITTLGKLSIVIYVYFLAQYSIK